MAAHEHKHSEVAEVVNRLEKIVVEYLQQAERAGVRLDGEQLLQVVEVARLQAKGREPQKAFSETVEGYMMSGLYEEIIQQPSAVFQYVEQDGHTFARPMTMEVWQEVLDEFLLRVEHSLPTISPPDESSEDGLRAEAPPNPPNPPNPPSQPNPPNPPNDSPSIEKGGSPVVEKHPYSLRGKRSQVQRDCPSPSDAGEAAPSETFPPSQTLSSETEGSMGGINQLFKKRKQ